MTQVNAVLNHSLEKVYSNLKFNKNLYFALTAIAVVAAVVAFGMGVFYLAIAKSHYLTYGLLFAAWVVMTVVSIVFWNRRCVNRYDLEHFIEESVQYIVNTLSKESLTEEDKRDIRELSLKITKWYFMHGNKVCREYDNKHLKERGTLLKEGDKETAIGNCVYVPKTGMLTGRSLALLTAQIMYETDKDSDRRSFIFCDNQGNELISANHDDPKKKEKRQKMITALRSCFDGYKQPLLDEQEADGIRREFSPQSQQFVDAIMPFVCAQGLDAILSCYVLSDFLAFLVNNSTKAKPMKLDESDIVSTVKIIDSDTVEISHKQVLSIGIEAGKKFLFCTLTATWRVRREKEESENTALFKGLPISCSDPVYEIMPSE